MIVTAPYFRSAGRAALLAVTLCLLPVTARAAANGIQTDLPRFGEQIYVIGEIPFLEPVEPTQPVTIRFGIGELEIETADANQIEADLEVTCRDSLSAALCDKYRSRLRLEPKRGPEGVEVRLVGLPKWKMRKLRLEGHVTVPRWSPLTVHVGIGEVDIRSEAENLSVAMGIGDLTVRVPEAIVGSVDIGTRIGDASMWSSDGPVVGTRRRLIGARVSWLEGPGPGKIVVGLRIGDAKVVLE